WNFLTLDKFRLPRYIFHIFAGEISNTLDHSKIALLVETVHEKTLATDEKLEELVSEICRSRPSQAVTCKQFDDFCATHLTTLSPLVNLQTRLRQRVVGEFFWKDCVSMRTKHPTQLEMHYITNLHEEITHKKARYKVGEGNSGASSATGSKSPKKKAKKRPEVERNSGGAAQLTKQGSLLKGFYNMQARISAEADAKKKKGKSK
ncbi:unnamed protein product, partial [Symbiodinium microadriaticum]